jgi:hypothetical protein
LFSAHKLDPDAKTCFGKKRVCCTVRQRKN